MNISPSTRHFVEVLYGQAQLGTPDVKLEALMKQLNSTTGDAAQVSQHKRVYTKALSWEFFWLHENYSNYGCHYTYQELI